MAWTIEEWADANGIKYWEIYDDSGANIKHYDNLNHPDNTTGIPGLNLPRDIRALVFDRHQETPAAARPPMVARRGLEIILDNDWGIVRKEIQP